MKGKFILLLALFFLNNVEAQPVSRHISGIPWVPIDALSGATEMMPTDFTNTAGVVDMNDGMGYLPMPFAFNFLGNTYNTGTSFLGVSVNGFMTFSNSNTNGSKIIVSDNSTLFSNAAPNDFIAAYFDDLNFTGDGLTGHVFYQTTGAPGSRIFIIQWQNFPTYSSGNVAGINFGVRLNEGSNSIDFLHGPVVAGVTPGRSPLESASSGINGSVFWYDLTTGSSKVNNGMVNSDRWGDYSSITIDPLAPTSMSGVYVIPGPAFPNLSEFVAALNTNGVSGPVTANLTSVGNGNILPFIFGPITGTSAINTITIGAALPLTSTIINFGGPVAGFIGTDQNPTSEAAAAAAWLRGWGCDRITVKDFGIATSDPLASLPVGMFFSNYSSTDGATNNTISNNRITLDRTNPNSLGFLFDAKFPPANASGANSSNKIYDNLFFNTLLGVKLNGNSVFPDILNEVSRNTIGAPYVGIPSGDIGGPTGTFIAGIEMTNQNNFTLEDNIVQNIINSGGPCAGYYINGFSGPLNIVRRNTLRGQRDISTTVPGPKHSFVILGNPVGNNVITCFDNIVTDLSSAYSGAATSSRQMVGMFLGGGNTNTYNLFFNSIDINGSGSPNVSNTNIELSDNNPQINLWGNCFLNETPNQAGAATHSIIKTANTNNFGSAGSVSNYNDFFISNTTNGPIAITNATQRATLANWIAGMTGNPGSDANSISQNPLFVGPTDLHVQAASPVINAAIQGTTGVTNDIDGQLRPNGAAFDIGADEFYSTLPVSLLNLSGEKLANGNLIRWTTVTESNNKVFEIQRMTALGQFETIGNVFSQALGGNSTSELFYSFLDLNPPNRKLYYRLKQTDIDNHSRFSNILVIDLKNSSQVKIAGIFPNPAALLLNLIIESPVKAKFKLTIYDQAGRMVKQIVTNVNAGTNSLEMDISRLSHGSYVVSLINESNEPVSTAGFIKQ